MQGYVNRNPSPGACHVNVSDADVPLNRSGVEILRLAAHEAAGARHNLALAFAYPSQTAFQKK